MAKHFTKNTLQHLFDECSIKELKSIIDEVSVYAEIIIQYAFEDFVELSTHIKPYLSKLKLEMNNEDDIDVEVKKQTLNNLNKIIFELQYHDIIRQKLEHIDESYLAVLNEMKGLTNIDDVNDTNYIYVLPEISQLTIDQFQLIEQEYKEACTDISSALKQIEQNKSIAKVLDFSITNTFNNIVNLSEVIQQINQSLQKIITVSKLNTTDTFEQKTLDKLKAIYNLYTMQSERNTFDKLFYSHKIEEEEEDIELF